MLFKTTTEIQKYMEVDSTVNFASLQSSIRAAEKELIVPVLGVYYYIDLNAKYNANLLSVAEAALMDVIQAALAPHAMYLYVPKAEVNITDGGLRRNETDNSKTAYQYQVTNLRKSLLNESEKAVEFLITFLEAHKADYPLWTSTSEFKKYRSLFIKSGSEFNEFYRTQSPYCNYWAMRSVMEDVEQHIIKKTLGADQFKALKDKDLLNDPIWSEFEKELLYKLKKSIASFTIANAISQLPVRMDEYGITVTSSSTFSSKDDESKRGAAADNQLSQLLRDAKATGEAWLNEAFNYLTANASSFVFTEWFAWQLSLKLAPEDRNRDPFCESLNGTFSLF